MGLGVTWTSAEWWSQLPTMKKAREMPRWWGSGSNSAPPADHDVHEDDHDAGEW